MTGPERSRAAIFLDRDGVINQPPPPEERYITRPEDFHLMPGIADLIRFFNDLPLPLIVITNQKCVAIGRLSPEGLEAIHARMHALLAAKGAHVDAVYHCPHDETAQCDCRKPKPGMILRAAREYDLNPSSSWLIGDQPRDCAAGKAAGCRTLLLGDEICPDADLKKADIFEVQAWAEKFFRKKQER
ncbi:MAG: HAD family hydrolase [Verrucomicrobia bacterium]|nr:HAD family hydrolase [Verrucomicrobiota bacterium]MCH8511102.1 HAD family hydrolase [Kiritimatiellia bacterium]